MNTSEELTEYHPWRFVWVLIIIVLLLSIVAIYLFQLAYPSVDHAEATVAEKRNGIKGETFNLHLIADPYAQSFLQARRKLEKLGDVKLNIVISNSYDLMRDQTLLGAKDTRAKYDIVSIDIVWVGNFAKNDVMLELDDLIKRDQLDTSDFLPIAYQQSIFQGKQYALPIQPHAEMLWYRKDIFKSAGVEAPVTTEDVLKVAEQLHQPNDKVYGICWNAQRGVPLGQTMAHFYGAFGQRLIDEEGKPKLNTDKGIKAAKFALALLAYSPPDILQMAWNKRIQRFASGHAAMTYGWTGRQDAVEVDEQSVVQGKVGYAPAPYCKNANPVTLIGTWSLAIPSNIGSRKEKAWAFLKWITSPEVMAILAESGNAGVPRVSLLSDPVLEKQYPSFMPIKQLSEKNELQDWMRPAVPEWPGLCQILGTVYYEMLLGKLTPEQAAEEAQRQAIILFESNKN